MRCGIEMCVILFATCHSAASAIATLSWGFCNARLRDRRTYSSCDYSHRWNSQNRNQGEPSAFCFLREPAFRVRRHNRASDRGKDAYSNRKNSRMRQANFGSGCRPQGQSLFEKNGDRVPNALIHPSRHVLDFGFHCFAMFVLRKPREQFERNSWNFSNLSFMDGAEPIPLRDRVAGPHLPSVHIWNVDCDPVFDHAAECINDF